MILYLIETASNGSVLQMAIVDGRKEDFDNRPEWHVFDTFDAAITVLNKRWTGSAWETVPEPEPVPPEPTQEEINNLLIMEGIAGLYETQITLENRMATDNITVMEGIAGLFESQMGGM